MFAPKKIYPRYFSCVGKLYTCMAMSSCNVFGWIKAVVHLKSISKNYFCGVGKLYTCMAMSLCKIFGWTEGVVLLKSMSRNWKGVWVCQRVMFS